MNMFALFLFGPALEGIVGRVPLPRHLPGRRAAPDRCMVLWSLRLRRQHRRCLRCDLRPAGRTAGDWPRKARLNSQWLVQNLILGVVITVVGLALHLLAGPPRRLPRRRAGRGDHRLRAEGPAARSSSGSAWRLLAAVLLGAHRSCGSPPSPDPLPGGSLGAPAPSSYDAVAGAVSSRVGTPSGASRYPQVCTQLWITTARVILHRRCPQCGDPDACTISASRPEIDSSGERDAFPSPGRRLTHRSRRRTWWHVITGPRENLLPLGREAEPDRHERDADDEVPLAEVVEDPAAWRGRRRRRRRCRSTAGR